MKRRRKWNLLTVWALLAAVLLGSVGHAPAKAQEKKTYSGDGFDVTFTVESQWDGAFNGNIRITNTGRKSIEDWVLSFEMPHEVTNIWDAVIQKRDGNRYLVKNAGWNQDIPAGGSVSFGFGAKASGKVKMPEKYTMPIGEKTTGTSDFEAVFQVSSDWKDGYTAAITLTNSRTSRSKTGSWNSTSTARSGQPGTAGWPPTWDGTTWFRTTPTTRTYAPTERSPSGSKGCAPTRR